MFLQLRSQIGILKKQTEMQEAGFGQWIATRNWKVSFEKEEYGLRLAFDFEIANPTSLPLTIRRVDFKDRGICGETSIPLTYPESEGYTIPPNESRAMNHEILLGDDLKALFQTGGAIPTPLDVRINYVDRLGKNCAYNIFLICTVYQDRPAHFGFYGSCEEREKSSRKTTESPN
jgi:hypothetical protein